MSFWQLDAGLTDTPYLVVQCLAVAITIAAAQQIKIWGAEEKSATILYRDRRDPEADQLGSRKAIGHIRQVFPFCRNSGGRRSSLS
jgi:hypothetical protein